MDSQVGSFRQILHKISSHISLDTLDELKYLCQDALSKAQINSVKTSLDLLSALEENCKISAGNTEYLADLLSSVGLHELVTLLNYGSFNEICEESNLSHKNIPQQLAFSLQHPSDALEQARHHSPFNNYNSLHYNEAASPMYSVSESQNHPRDRSSWEDSTREFPASGHSAGSVPMHTHQFVLSSVDLLKTPGNQWQRQLGCNTYNEQSSNEHAESLRWSESVSAQSFHENLSIESYHSVNCYNLPAQRMDKGLQAYGNQIYNTSSVKNMVLAAPYITNLPEQFPPPTAVENEDTTAAYACSADFFTKENKWLQQENHQLNQELNAVREKCKQKQQYIEGMQQQIEQMQQQIEQMQQQMEKIQQREQEGSRAQYISRGDRYQMDKSPHGIAVIINNHAFHSTHPSDSPMPNRRGSQVDEDKLCTLWKNLGYNVRVLKNRTASNLLEDLYRIAALNLSNDDSFVCCILSHGYCGGVFGADGKPVELKTITSLFEGRNCPSLFGKPKMFFIQACRGGDEDKGVDEVQKDGNDKSLPSNADFLLAYSTASGMTSYRSEEFGSWYISVLYEVLKDHTHSFHLLDMLTMVNDKLSYACTSKGFKQCPAPLCFLRKQVWFFSNPS